MPDLLTHVLLAYAACRLLAARGWIDRRHVPIGMGGGAVPDLTKLYLVVDSDQLSAVFGRHLVWQALHTLGSALVVAALVALAFERGERRTVFGLLAGGSVVHLFLDSLIKRADGLAPPYLYPFSWWQGPAGNLYLSSDPWLSVVAVCVVAVALAWLRVRTHDDSRSVRTVADRSD